MGMAEVMMAGYAEGTRPGPPFAYIVRDNTGSLSLFESVGFVQTEAVRWCRFAELGETEQPSG